MTARSSDTINVFDTRGKGRSAVDFGVMTTNEDILAEFGEDNAVISERMRLLPERTRSSVFRPSVDLL